MKMTMTFKTIERLSIFFLANYRSLFCMLLDFGVHTFVFFYVRWQRLYVCLCIAYKQSRCAFVLIVNALVLCSRMPRERPPPRTRVNITTDMLNEQPPKVGRGGLHGACIQA